MRVGRRLKAWEEAGLIRRNAEAIIVTKSVTPTITDAVPTVTELVSVTLILGATVPRRSMTRSSSPHSSCRWRSPAYRPPCPLMASPQSLPARSGPSSPWRCAGSREARRGGVADRALARGAAVPMPGPRHDDRPVDEPERDRRVRLPHARPHRSYGGRRSRTDPPTPRLASRSGARPSPTSIGASPRSTRPSRNRHDLAAPSVR
jgi:hypothetical protein